VVVEFGDEPAQKPLSLTEVKTSVDLNVDEIEFIRYGCKVGVGRWIWRASIHIRRQQRERERFVGLQAGISYFLNVLLF
jgi:hypothetical protein